MVLVCGGLFVVSAANSDGTDLRPERYQDLASVVEREADRVDSVRGDLAQLNAEVDSLARGVDDRDVRRYKHRIQDLYDPAGMLPATGEGLTVTLSDAPAELIEATDQDPNLMVVHQQDIQAVVNALWKGGAKAVTIQGQRVISTTGIKCDGSSVQLQGVPYPQPYEISAVGDQAELLTALATDAYLAVYRAQAEDPDIGIGWDVEADDELVAPAYDGVVDFRYAEPIDS